jgi:purine-binding chemotaxis protein CheW
MVETTTLDASTSADAEASTEDTTQYLTFFVAEERYAIDILDVKEIIEVANITRVPMTPDHIRGVLNLRGTVLPVVDLRARLSKGVSELTKRSAIILVEVTNRTGQHMIGMLVDEVHEILEIDAAHLQPPPDFGTAIRTDFIQAMGRVDDVFIILLAINHVLSTDELAALQKVAQHTDIPESSPEQKVVTES